MEIKKAVEVFKSYERMGTKNPTKSDRPHFQILFDETRRLIGKKGKAINWTCSSCINSVYGVVSNYINYHYKEVKEEKIQVSEKKEIDYSKLKLSELRKLFPEIKANSVKKFIKQIG